MGANEKTLAAVEAAARAEVKRQFKNASRDFNTADDALAILRQAQAVVAKMAEAVDRMDLSVCALIGGVR